MTVSAHTKRHVYGGATRYGGIIDYAPNHSSTWFNELYPHLRNVDVGQRPLKKRICDYLKRRPGRSLAQIVAKFGGERSKIERCINANLTMFQRQGQRWFAREG